jgi:hypothetical protein
MHIRSTASLWTITSLLAAPAVLGQAVTFEMIPGALSANDMSPDGRFIVGEMDQNGDGFPDGTYILDTELDEMTILPAPGLDAVAVSDDGQFVVGDIPDPEGTGAEVAGRWSAATNQWQSLGHLPDALQCPSLSNGYETSADGSVVVGLSWDGCDGLGFIWTHETGMQPLESMANGTNRASVVSADGGVIAGFAQGSFSRTPTLWDSAGSGQLLDPPDGDAIGEIHGLSDNGQVLLGTWNEDAIRWTADGGVEVLGDGTLIPGWVGHAMDIADDGTIVGFDMILLNRRAWFQPEGAGPLKDFQSFVESNGGIVPTGLILEVCQAISRDGRSIVGHGLGTGAWRVTIEPVCLADTNGSGTIDVDDLTAVILDWGTDGSANNADIDGSGIVDVDDLTAIILAWGPC